MINKENTQVCGLWWPSIKFTWEGSFQPKKATNSTIIWIKPMIFPIKYR